MPYIGRSLGDGVRARYIYAATSGQTTFSGNDANGIALAYSDTLYMDIYQNGVLLKPVTDYASTTGTSVVLTTGASTDDVVEMIVYDSFAVADTVSAANGGSFGGAVSVAGAFTSPGIDDNADATAITIDSSERVMIGTTTEGYSSGDDLTIATSGHTGITIRSSASHEGAIFFSDATSGTGEYAGYIQYIHSNDSLILASNASEKIRILSSGGITFNGDTAAANALDDYEEGTFTPSIGGSGVVYGTASGSYRKIGNFVFVYLQITISTIGSPATTNSIQGLPFAPALSNQHFGVAYYDGITNNTYELHGNFRSDSSIRMEGKTSFGGGQNSGHGWAQNGAAIYGSGSYYTS